MEIRENTSPQFGILKEFEYENTTVLAGISPLGEMVAIKPVCENLGIDRKWQQDKIKNDPQLGPTGGMVKVLAADGKLRDMYCLPASHFQNWLWSLTATENINVHIWEEYKKGLVVHLLMMLKVSLEEVQRLRRVEEKFHLLKKHFALFAEKSEMGSELSKLAKENWREAKSIKSQIMDLLEGDTNQLEIF